MEKPSSILYLVVFALSLTLASILTPYLRKIALSLNVLDRPSQSHKTHQEPVPYLGGLSIVIPVVLLSAFGNLIISGIEDSLRLFLFLIPSLIMSMVGFVDDFKNLPAGPRFLMQLGTSTIVSILLIQSGFSSRLTSYLLIDLIISVFWIVGITNAFNFIDNLDGGAAGVAVIASVSLFCLGVMLRVFLSS